MAEFGPVFYCALYGTLIPLGNHSAQKRTSVVVRQVSTMSLLAKGETANPGPTPSRNTELNWISINKVSKPEVPIVRRASTAIAIGFAVDRYFWKNLLVEVKTVSQASSPSDTVIGQNKLGRCVNRLNGRPATATGPSDRLGP
jgi:hypothetical protein